MEGLVPVLRAVRTDVELRCDAEVDRHEADVGKVNVSEVVGVVVHEPVDNVGARLIAVE